MKTVFHLLWALVLSLCAETFGQAQADKSTDYASGDYEKAP